MAVAFESDGGTVFAASASNAAITVPLPATRTVGSVLFCFIFTRLITDVLGTAPTGYTLITGFPKSSATASGGRLWLYARIVDGSETAPTVACTSAATGNTGDLWGAILSCYSGVDTSGGIQNIFDNAPVLTDASGTTTCTYAAITFAAADSMRVGCLARFSDALDTFTPTASWSEREDASSTTRTGAQVHWQDFLPGVSGAQGAVTVAPSTTTAARYVSLSFGLKAAVLVAKQTGVAQISLASLNDPGTDERHAIHTRARVTAGTLGRIRAALYQGATNISGDLEIELDLTTTLTEYILPIAAASVASITDYSNLEIRVWGYTAGGGTAVNYEIDQLWLEVPKPATLVSTVKAPQVISAGMGYF